jgi:hypothetical protein
MQQRLNTWLMQGTIDRATGIVELEFDALFDFSAKPFYSAPSLVVRTLLTTEAVQGRFRSATGQRMDAAGNARWGLAGCAVWLTCVACMAGSCAACCHVETV